VLLFVWLSSTTVFLHARTSFAQYHHPCACRGRTYTFMLPFSESGGCLSTAVLQTNYQDGTSNKYDAIKAAVGHMVLQGLSAGTISSRTRILCRYVARDLSIIDSFDALHLSQLMRGIRWSHGRTGTRRVKPFLSLRTLMRVLYPEQRRGGRQGQRSLMLRT
jgi:hypothetical protein